MKLLFVFTASSEARVAARWVNGGLGSGNLTAQALFYGSPSQRASGEQTLQQFAKNVHKVVGVCSTRFIEWTPNAPPSYLELNQCDLVVFEQGVTRPLLRIMGGKSISTALGEFIRISQKPFLVLKSALPWRRVLYATDRSDDALGALKTFLQLPFQHAPTVYVITVISELVTGFHDYISRSMSEDILGALKMIPSRRNKHLQEVAATLRQHRIPVRTRLVTGRFLRIMEEEMEEDYDLILLGARGRLERSKKTGVGKHTAAIVLGSPVSVLTGHS